MSPYRWILLVPAPSPLGSHPGGSWHMHTMMTNKTRNILNHTLKCLTSLLSLLELVHTKTTNTHQGLESLVYLPKFIFPTLSSQSSPDICPRDLLISPALALAAGLTCGLASLNWLTPTILLRKQKPTPPFLSQKKGCGTPAFGWCWGGFHGCKTKHVPLDLICCSATQTLIE